MRGTEAKKSVMSDSTGDHGHSGIGGEVLPVAESESGSGSPSPSSSSISTSSSDDTRQQPLRQSGSGSGSGSCGGTGKLVPGLSSSSYEAPPSPMPSPIPQMASVSIDSSDDFGLGEIFANERRDCEQESQRGGNPGANADANDLSSAAAAAIAIAAPATATASLEGVADALGSGRVAAPASEAQDGCEPMEDREPEKKGGGDSKTPSPAPSDSKGTRATPAPAPVSISLSSAAKDGDKAEQEDSEGDKEGDEGGIGATSQKLLQPKLPSATDGTASSDDKSPPALKGGKGPPQSPPPLPAEEQLAGHRRMACKARSVPVGHTPHTAYLTIPPDAPHGMVLACSHSECAASGKRFRFCVVCDIPVAKRNFLRRHSHGLISAPSVPTPGGAPEPAAAAMGGIGSHHPGVRVAPGSDGPSPPCTPQCDSPASPTSASSGLRSDDEVVAVGKGGGSSNRHAEVRDYSSRAHKGGLSFASPRHEVCVNRPGGGVGPGGGGTAAIDPTSPMSVGSVRPRTSSDGSGRSAMGNPGKRPREGTSPRRGGGGGGGEKEGVGGNVANNGTAAPPPTRPLQVVVQHRASDHASPGNSNNNRTPHLARPMPFRPPPIQHCVSWPMATSGHPHHHGQHQVPPSHILTPTSQAHPVRPIAMVPRACVVPGSSHWAPSIPGGGGGGGGPHYPPPSWQATATPQHGAPLLLPQQQQPLAPPPPPVSRTSRVGGSLQPSLPMAPQLPPPPPPSSAQLSRPGASQPTPTPTPSPTQSRPRPAPRYLRGPAMSFDAAKDRDDGERRNIPSPRTEPLSSPGLDPELQSRGSSLRSGRAGGFKGGGVGGENSAEGGAWSGRNSSADRIEFRRHSPSPEMPPSIWRGWMRSTSDTPEGRGGELRIACVRSRQLSEPPHFLPGRHMPFSEDDFEPPTPEISVMRLTRRERSWLTLLQRRPFEDEKEALRSWMDEVLVLSDPRWVRGEDAAANVVADAAAADDFGTTHSPSEAVHQARSPAAREPGRSSGDVLVKEEHETPERGSVRGVPNRAGARWTAMVHPLTRRNALQQQKQKQKQRDVEREGVMNETHGDDNSNSAAVSDAPSRPSSGRLKPKNVVTPPEFGFTAEKIAEGFVGLFGCGALLCTDGDDAGAFNAPCAPCAHPRDVPGNKDRRLEVPKDLSVLPLPPPPPVSKRQQSKESAPSHASLGPGSAAAFFESAAMMDIDRNTDSPFERLAGGGSVSSASVSQIGEEDMEDPERRAALIDSVDDFVVGGTTTVSVASERDTFSDRRRSDSFIAAGRNVPTMREEMRVGSANVNRHNVTFKSSKLRGLDMHPQWRGGKGVARG